MTSDAAQGVQLIFEPHETCWPVGPTAKFGGLFDDEAMPADCEVKRAASAEPSVAPLDATGGFFPSSFLFSSNSHFSSSSMIARPFAGRSCRFFSRHFITRIASGSGN